MTAPCVVTGNLVTNIQSAPYTIKNNIFAYFLHPASLLTERLATFYLLYYALKAKLKSYECCIYLLLYSDDFCKKIPPQI